jgi:cytochrome c551
LTLRNCEERVTTEMSSVKLLFLVCCFWVGCTPGNQKDKSVKFQQYYVEGEVLYKQHCANCHQTDGSGLGRVYPPINKSDFMDENLSDVICLIKNGKQGEILVNGVMYNQPMAGIPFLTDLEVAEIATYIYNTWSHQQGLLDVTMATSVLKGCMD